MKRQIFDLPPRVIQIGMFLRIFLWCGNANFVFEGCGSPKMNGGEAFKCLNGCEGAKRIEGV